uniref:Uncharacterized protein n=1 Tax=Arundo donax TaxID=35708 RepID=A0A0A9GXJ4_ARUDO
MEINNTLTIGAQSFKSTKVIGVSHSVSPKFQIIPK